MKKILLFIITTILLFSCKKDLTTKLVENLEKHNSLHYKAIEYAFYSNEPDTTITPYETFIQKANHDTIKKAFIWVENLYRPYTLVYNLHDFYLIMPTKGKTRHYTRFPWSFISDNDFTDIFINPDTLLQLKNDTSFKINCIDTTIDNKQTIKINILKSDEHFIFYFSKNNGLPLRSEHIIKLKNGNFYNNILKITQADFNYIDTAKLNLKLKNLLKSNPPLPYNPEAPDVIKENMLQIGDNAPDINGIIYKTGKKFTLSDYLGKKIIIIDFWYTHCRPCVKAIPELSKAYTQLKDSGLIVFGLNSIDNVPENINFLYNFTQNRKITYNIILTQPSADKIYKVIGYPSMYVINKQGKIAYVEIGYEPENFKKMINKVRELLNKK